MIFNKTRKEIVRTGDLVAKGTAYTYQSERTDFNKTFEHIYKNIRSKK